MLLAHGGGVPEALEPALLVLGVVVVVLLELRARRRRADAPGTQPVGDRDSAGGDPAQPAGGVEEQRG